MISTLDNPSKFLKDVEYKIFPWHSNKSSCGRSGEILNYVDVWRNILLRGDTCLAETTGLLAVQLDVLMGQKDYVPFDCSCCTCY